MKKLNLNFLWNNIFFGSYCLHVNLFITWGLIKDIKVMYVVHILDFYELPQIFLLIIATYVAWRNQTSFPKVSTLSRINVIDISCLQCTFILLVLGLWLILVDNHKNIRRYVHRVMKKFYRYTNTGIYMLHRSYFWKF